VLEILGGGGQLHDLLGERVGKEDDHGDNEHVDRQGLDHRQTDQHDRHDLAAGTRVASNPFNGTLDRQTLTETGPEGPDCHAEAGGNHTPCEKLHCTAPFHVLLWLIDSYTV
jgi:hypothetical protein